MLTMQGRNAVIFGVANKRSIAWAIVQKLHEAGAKLAIGYQNERLKAEAEGLIADLPGAEAFQCDVSNDVEIAQVFAREAQAGAAGRLLDVPKHVHRRAFVRDLQRCGNDSLNDSMMH